jgi:hypothetical protein
LAGVKFPQASCHDLERRVRIWRGSIQTHITCSFLILPSPKRLVWLAAAGSMFTIAHELGLIAGLTAVFTAILAVLSVLGDSAIALGMRALRWVRHSVLLSCTPSRANRKPLLSSESPQTHSWRLLSSVNVRERFCFSLRADAAGCASRARALVAASPTGPCRRD